MKAIILMMVLVSSTVFARHGETQEQCTTVIRGGAAEQIYNALDAEEVSVPDFRLYISTEKTVENVTCRKRRPFRHDNALFFCEILTCGE